MTTFRFAALGMDHRHIYGMSQGMIDAGAFDEGILPGLTRAEVMPRRA